MPRKGPVQKRESKPDLVYNDKLVGKLINKVMLDGKKSTAETIVYGAFDEIKERTNEEPLEVFRKAIENIKPSLEVRPRRVGGATFQVPMEVEPRRSLTLSIRWLVAAARDGKGKPMSTRLADEIIDAYKETGTAIKKKEDLHRMAEANRAFAHYRW